ncbi:MAG: hypothetical protein AAFR16_11465, partial [Pseudomonadota bacterium]
APPEVAAVYADVKATTGEASVNLWHRVLATEPHALSAAWGALKPAYASGALAAAGARVCAAARAERRAAADPPAPVPAPAWATLQFYLRTNPANLAALSLLAALLEDGPPPAGAEAGAAAPSTPAPAAAASPPPPPDLTVLAPETRAQVARIEALCAPDGPAPTAVRHLALWPELLAAWEAALAPAEAERAALAARLRAAAEAEARALPLRRARPLMPPAASAHARSVCAAFRALIPPVTAALLILEGRLAPARPPRGDGAIA